ncbi:MAG: LysR substrate-binding domain-containing protein [Parahaliea sp.]
MDTELLRTFLEVRNTRHFGKAADNLCITQAAVSARIKQLEEVLGASLFSRGRNNIRLSVEGEQLVPHAESMLLALARARQAVRLGLDDRNRLRVGVSRGLWAEPLQKRLAALRKDRPELRVGVLEWGSGEMIAKLLDRSLDCALLCGPPGLAELEVVVLGAFSLRLYGSAGRQSSLARAMDAHYVYLDWGDSYASFHSRQFGEQVVPRLHTDIAALALAAVREQGGACYLPASQRQALAQQGLAPVRGAPVFTRQLSMVFHPDAPQRELIEGVARSFAGMKV